MKKKKMSTNKLYKIFVYVALITLAISIIVPIAWVFMSSLKTQAEFQGNPWSLPISFYFQNFIDAFEKANMAKYFMNSIIVTALALVILVVVSLPAAYVLARFDFKIKKFVNAAFMGGLFINVNYIVVPIFLMLSSWDDTIFNLFGGYIFLDNIFFLRLSMPQQQYLSQFICSVVILEHCLEPMKRQHSSMDVDISKLCLRLWHQWLSLV